MSLQTALLQAARYTGMFHLSDRLSARQLRVLGYHGFAFEDEHLFRPKLFMRVALFAARMAWLAQHDYWVITLEEARTRLKDGTLRSKSVVITLDDGFYSVLALVLPILKRYGFPATLYMTTYYCRRPNPIFRLVVQYMFWATPKSLLDLSGLLPGSEDLTSTCGEAGEHTQWRIIEHGEVALSEDERLAIVEELGKRLGVDYGKIRDSRKFSLLTEDEVAHLAQEGLEIQLHTHRHQLLNDPGLAHREIEDNRNVLAPLTGQPLHHLCYPSGLWSKNLWPVLEALGVDTATTCEPGLVSADTPSLAWPRILDADSIPPIVFEAEISGFKSQLRTLKGFLKRRL
jgi:peptidoglycan/xylan/chitin deacetylase (PgdA/CDA1 family)